MKSMFRPVGIAVSALALVAIVFYNRLEAQSDGPLPDRVRELESQVKRIDLQLKEMSASITSLKAPRAVHRSYDNCKPMADSQTAEEKATEPNVCGAAYSYYGVNRKNEKVCCTAQAD